MELSSSPFPATRSSLALLFIGLALLVVSSLRVEANGVNRVGIGAKSMGAGGTAVASPDDSYAGMAVNPALLGYLEDSDFSLTVVGVVADGAYTNRFGGRGGLDENTGMFPELVIRAPLKNGIGLGFSIIPEQTRMADWVYGDVPGGVDGGTTYGLRHHRSRLEGIRTAVGVGIEISDTLSLGASVGAVYNRNELVAPYIFQSHPALKGFKTLLAMETEGWGVNGDLGLTWKPDERLILGFAYRTPTVVDSTGTARGDIGAQLRSLGLRGVESEFVYDSLVKNEFPDQLTFGGSLRMSDRAVLSAEAEWIRWSNGFDDLTVDLTKGSNAAINDLLGSNGIVDTIPLRWRDTMVYRMGVDYTLTKELMVRAGYQYGESPVPNSSLSPMTGAISEHTVTCGLTWAREPYELSLAYQQDLPSTRTINGSRLAGGEYAGGTVDLTTHWIGLSVRYEF